MIYCKKKKKKWVNCCFAFPFPGGASICSLLNPVFSTHFVAGTRADKSRGKKQTWPGRSPWLPFPLVARVMVFRDPTECIEDKRCIIGGPLLAFIRRLSRLIYWLFSGGTIILRGRIIGNFFSTITLILDSRFYCGECRYEICYLFENEMYNWSSGIEIISVRLWNFV